MPGPDVRSKGTTIESQIVSIGDSRGQFGCVRVYRGRWSITSFLLIVPGYVDKWSLNTNNGKVRDEQAG